MTEPSIGLTHFTSAAIVVYVMNKLKSATWFPILNKDWTAANRAFSIVAAFLVSIGISYTWNSNTDGSHRLILDIPTWGALAVGLWHVINQYALQETLHQVTKPKDEA